MLMDNPSRDEPTTIGGIIVAVGNALDDHGISIERVIRAAGLGRMPANSPFDRMAPSNVARVMAAAVEATGDPYFGLKVAQHMRPISMHALGYSLSASETLRDFGERLARFARFATMAAQVEFVESPDGARLEIYDLRATVCAEAEDAWFGFLTRFMRDLANHQFGPSRVDLHRAAPLDGGSNHAAFFGCPVRFGCERVSFHLDAAIVDRRLPGASREIAEVNDQLVIAYLAKLDRDDIEHRVRAVLTRELAAGATTKDTVASKLNMSARTLQLKLADRGTSFYEVINDTRLALALAYMENRAVSISEMAYLLGFSDISNFSRAFKRWTGSSPSDHRAKLGTG